MTVLVHGQAEGVDVLPARLFQSHTGVVDGVFLLHAFPAVSPVLGASVADQEEYLGARVRLFQLGDGVANGGAHPGGVERSHAVYPPLHAVGERLVEVLDGVVLDVLASVA